MSPRINRDADQIRKTIREAEAVSDELMIACAKLKQVILTARQNPEVSVDAAQKALLRLGQAEGQALSMSTNLLRVHEELNRMAEIYCGPDDDKVTPMTAGGFERAEPLPELA